MTTPLASLQQSKAFKYGMSVFETVRFDRGRAHNVEAHFERFYQGASFLGLPKPNKERFVACIEAAIQSAPKGQGAIRIQLVDDDQEARLSWSVRPIAYKIETYKKGWRVSYGQYPKWSKNPLLRFKTAQYALNMLELQAVKAQGYDEVLFENDQAHVTEGAISNLYIIKNNKIMTAPLTDGLLPGTMRQRVNTWLAQHAYTLYEQSINRDDILGADAIFATNALVGIVRISEVDGKSYDDHPVIATLQKGLMGDWTIEDETR